MGIASTFVVYGSSNDKRNMEKNLEWISRNYSKYIKLLNRAQVRMLQKENFWRYFNYRDRGGPGDAYWEWEYRRECEQFFIKNLKKKTSQTVMDQSLTKSSGVGRSGEYKKADQSVGQPLAQDLSNDPVSGKTIS